MQKIINRKRVSFALALVLTMVSVFSAPLTAYADMTGTGTETAASDDARITSEALTASPSDAAENATPSAAKEKATPSVAGRLKKVKVIPAARITETGKLYDTVQKAVDGAEDNQTVQMLSDRKENITVGSGKTVNLDLNGCVLASESAGSSVITIAGSSELTLTDSAPEADHSGDYAELPEGGVITGGNAADGGGIYVGAGALLTMTGGTICGNTAADGGGIYVAVTIDNTNEVYLAGKIFLTDVTISDNEAESGGGMFLDAGKTDKNLVYASQATLTGVTLSENKAGNGGGIYLNGGQILMTGCTVEKNTATGNGGGICEAVNTTISGAADAGFKCGLLNTAVTENTAAGNGGGVYIRYHFLPGCFAAGTPVTMADGTVRPIEDISEGDLIRTFDHESGRISSAKVYLTYKSETRDIPFTLTFDNGRKLSIADCHDLLEQTSRKYVTISEENAESYIGRSFYGEDGKWHKLLNVTKETEACTYYSVCTAEHQNCFANGFLSVPDDTDYLLNIYELDENLRADPLQLEADIAEYGLMSFEYASEKTGMSREYYEDCGARYLYIAFGKGLRTEEESLALYDRTNAAGSAAGVPAKEENHILSALGSVLRSVRSLFVIDAYAADPELPSLDDDDQILKAVLTVGSGTEITGNTADGRRENVYLAKGDENALIHFYGESGSRSGISVGVSTETVPTEEAPVKISDTAAVTDKNFLFSDNTDYTVGYNAADSGYLELKIADAAQIVESGVKYATVQKAVDAATDGQTVQMLDDCRENITVATDDVLTLDLNGFVLASAADGSSVITNNGTLTLTDSDTDSTHTGEFEDLPAGGVITGAAPEDVSDPAGLQGGGVNNTGIFYMYGGTVTGNNAGKDGTVKSSAGGGVYSSGDMTVGDTAVIKGNYTQDINGNTIADNLYLPDGKTVSIGTGEYEPAVDMNICITTQTAPAKSAPVVIATGAASGNEGHFYDDRGIGFAWFNSTDQVVELRVAAAEITDAGGNTTKYETVQAALNAAADGQTVKLISDAEEQLGLHESYQASGITLDLNGHVLTYPDGIILTVDDVTLDITDSSPDAPHDGTYSGLTGGLIAGGSTGINIAMSGVLNLRAGTLYGNGNTSRVSAVAVTNGSTLNMYSGAAIRNNVSGGNGAGVSVEAESTFNMYGGSITDNTANPKYAINPVCGGGVYNAGTFNMAGGTISGNKAKNKGGGVYNNGAMTVGGTAVIRDNTLISGTAGNLYLTTGTSLSIGTGEKTDAGDTEHNGTALPGKGMELSVTLNGAPGQFTANGSVTDVQYFRSDCTEYTVQYNAGSGEGSYLELEIPCAAQIVETGKKYVTVQKAIDAAANGQTVQLICDTAENITIASDDSITLDLNGYVLSAPDGERIVLNQGTLTITDSQAGVAHYFKYRKNSAWELDTAASEGIEVSAITSETADGTVVKVSGGILYGGCAADNGGAVSMQKDGAEVTTAFTGGSIVGCQAKCGAAIYQNEGTLLLNGGNIYGCLAGESGGGVESFANAGKSSAVNFSSGSIQYCSAPVGGGIYNKEYSSLKLSGTAVIARCSAASNIGGGVCTNGAFEMTAGSIEDCSANKGGGVFVNSQATASFTMTGGSVTGNNAAIRSGGVEVKGSLTLGGTAYISGNTLGSGTAAASNNIYLNGTGKTITVSEGFSGFAGVSTSVLPATGSPVTVTGTNDTDYSSCFASDSSDYTVRYNAANCLELAEVPYSITYILNDGGWKDSYTAPDSYTAGSGATLPADGEILRTGYTFGGWYGDAGFSGSPVTAISTGETGNRTFYAKWTAARYTVKLDGNGATGTGHTKEISAVYDCDMPALGSPALPVRTGHVFLGYYDAVTDGNRYYNADGTSARKWDRAQDNVSLYAQWEHVHGAWAYTADGAVLTAECHNPDCTLSGHKVSVTVKADSKTYSRTVYDGASLENETAWTAAGLTAPEISYYDRNGALLAEAPEKAGIYTAKITAGSAAAEKTFTVSPVSLTVTGTAAENKTYDGTAHASVNTGSLTGVIPGDTVSVCAAGSFANADAGTAKPVTVTYKLTGADAGNYTVSKETLSADISRKSIRVKADDRQSRIGKALLSLTYTADGLCAGDTFSGSLSTDADPNTAGSYDILQGSLTAGDNYTVSYTKGTYTVLAKDPQTLSFAKSAVTKKYGTEPFTQAVTGAAAEVSYSSDNTAVATVNAATGEVTVIAAGTAVITASAAEDADHAAAQASYTLTVTKRSVILTSSSDTKVYDGTPLVNASVTVGGDGFADGEGMIFDMTGSQKDAGTLTNDFIYTLTSGTAEENYEIETVAGTLTVTKRPVTLTSASAEKMYDGTPLTADSVTVSGDGFADGEGVAFHVTGSQKEPGTSKNTFTYTAEEGTSLSNYKIKTIEGKLTVKENSGKKNEETEETEPKTTRTGTGTPEKPAEGSWVKNSDGSWSFGNDGFLQFSETWGYIANRDKTGGDWYYFGADGKAKTGFQTIGGKTYYFRQTKDNRECAMSTGWLLAETGDWYYLEKTDGQNLGAMRKGWMTDPDDGYQYYLDPETGKMLTGRAVTDGKEHYFNETVPGASGWSQNADGDWVYVRHNVTPLGALIR